VVLLWLPLGAGQRIVQLSGRSYERLHAWRSKRPPLDLYHAALEVTTPDARYVVELAPVPDRDGTARGVVCEGPVGSRLLGRWRWFRYELRSWPGGQLPDRHLAVASPIELTTDGDRTRHLLELLPTAPSLTWGRDERHLGEMWNSNAVIAWLLVVGGLLTDAVRLPPHGRAPGWDAGIRLAELDARPLRGAEA
jgi:hypothetical protein